MLNDALIITTSIEISNNKMENYFSEGAKDQENIWNNLESFTHKYVGSTKLYSDREKVKFDV